MILSNNECRKERAKQILWLSSKYYVLLTSMHYSGVVGSYCRDWLVITSSSVQVTMEWKSRSAATESGHLRNFPMCMTKTEIKWSFVFSLSLVFLICVLLFCFLSAKCVSRSFTGNIKWKHHRLKWFRLMKWNVGALMKYCCSLLLPQGCVESSGVDHRRRRGSRTRASDAFCGKECCCRYLGR